MNDLTLAIIYTAKKHDGQTRKDGSPYIYHPLRVAEKLKRDGWSEIVQIAALLHDVLEDTNTSKAELLTLFNREIAEAVDLLTKKPGIPEEMYISAILKNQIAKAVKEADKIDNVLECVSKIQTEKEKRFATQYLARAVKYYKGKFSKELDTAIDKAVKQLEIPTVQEKQLPDFSDDRMCFFEIWNTYCCTLHMDDCQIGEESECWTYHADTISWLSCKLDIIQNYDDITLINVDKSALPELKIVHD